MKKAVPEVIAQLIALGADVNINRTEAFYSSPLFSAIANNAPIEIIQLLINAGADLNSKHYWHDSGRRIEESVLNSLELARAKKAPQAVIDSLIAAGARPSTVAV